MTADTVLPGESLGGLSAPGSFVHAWRITPGLTLERELIESLAVGMNSPRRTTIELFAKQRLQLVK
jgi:hypothetical protein